MKISGFTFIRNGVKFDFPFEESLRSLLPVVDELVVNIGIGDDATEKRIEVLAQESPKIKILRNIWDEKLRQGGQILSQQTNLALAACTGDWGIYLQADEVLHEADYAPLRQALESAPAAAEGLLFDYVHFYGDFFVVNRNPSAYRREIRAVRLGRGIESFGDAQGFRLRENGQLRKLKVVHSHTRIFHYGWVRPPETMQKKTKAFDTLYHENNEGTGDNHRYKHILGLEAFAGTHPKLMEGRIQSKSWKVDLLAQPMVFTGEDIRKWLALQWERYTGELPFSYKNYVRLD